MEYILIIQDAGSKMAASSSSLFRNKWRHHDILLLFRIIYMLTNFLYYYSFYQRPYLMYFSVYFNLRGIRILYTNRFNNMTS